MTKGNLGKINSHQTKKEKKTYRLSIRLPWDVVEENLCVRCGFCFDICPYNLIKPDDDLFPTIREGNLQRCTECGLCMKGCPAEVDFPRTSKKLFGRVPPPLDALGIIQNVYIGCACDPEIRSRGSSGGVVTGLLIHMLKKRLIDQALVCKMNENRPWEVNPILAQTEGQIIDCAQSKYTIVPQMRLIKQIMNSRKKVALVGIPCQIHAYRKFESWQKKTAENVQLVIGLGCHSTLEIEATRKLLQIGGVKLGELKKLEYRGGKAWPGGIHVTLANGELKSLHSGDIKSGFNRLALFYTPSRCLTCIDYSAEFSDLTVMDPWVRDKNGQYPYKEGYSLILGRNDKARKILDQAASDGSLFLKEIPVAMLASQLDHMVQKKKVGASIRIEKLRRKGKIYPKYNINFPKPSLGDQMNEKLDSMTRVLDNWKCTRDLGMRLAFSRLGDYLMEVRTAYKKHKFHVKNMLQSG